MSEVTLRSVTTTRAEVAVPAPTTWAELGKALTAVDQWAKREGVDTAYDDAVKVRVEDDEIVLWFDLPAPKASPNPEGAT